MNRRDFLRDLAATSAPTPAIPQAARQELPVVATPGSPVKYERGSRVLVADARAWLCRDDLGFYALDANCPHLGCLVRPEQTGFICPCHGSQFDATGQRQAGPSGTDLRYLWVDLDSTGNLVIRRDRLAGPDDRLIA